MNNYKHNKQHGAALVISLLIMLVMTMLGLSMLNSTTMEVKMASNNQQRQIAYQMAETALRAAEVVLGALTTEPQITGSFDGTGGLYNSFSGTPAPISNYTTWTDANSVVVPIDDFTNDPRYVVEYLGRSGRVPVDPNAPDTRPHAFKITAIGFGVDAAARYLLSSSFTKHLN